MKKLTKLGVFLGGRVGWVFFLSAKRLVIVVTSFM